MIFKVGEPREMLIPENEIMTEDALRKRVRFFSRVCLWIVMTGSVIKQIADPVYQSTSGNDFSSC